MTELMMITLVLELLRPPFVVPITNDTFSVDRAAGDFLHIDTFLDCGPVHYLQLRSLVGWMSGHGKAYSLLPDHNQSGNIAALLLIKSQVRGRRVLCCTANTFVFPLFFNSCPLCGCCTNSLFTPQENMYIKKFIVIQICVSFPSRSRLSFS